MKRKDSKFILPIIFCIVLNLTGCQNDIKVQQEYIPLYIEWDFDQEPQKTVEDVTQSVKEIRNEIRQQMPFYMKVLSKLEQTSLEKSLGFRQGKFIVYYSTETSTHEWIEQQATIEIVNKNTDITTGQLLFEIHNQTYPNFKNLDFMAIEGLGLKKDKSTPAIPVYEVYLGT